MTDEITARDRAIGVGAAALAHSVNDREPDDGAYDLATVVVSALLAHPELLRALAGAPAADVAHTCRPEGDPAQLRTGTLWTCPVDGAQWVSVNRMIGRQMRGEWRPRPPLPSTPPPPPPAPRPRAMDAQRPAATSEGVDAAGELEEHFVDANERMGEALVRIGMTLGLPRPTAQHHWGAAEILAKAEQLRAERDGWERVAAGLRQRDEAAQRAVEAIVRPGPAPELHRRQIVRLAEGWRPLARALAELCRTYDQTAPREWR